MFDTMERDISVPADSKTLIAVFKLSPVEASFLQVLLERDWVSKDEFPPANYSNRQVMYTLRKKLESKFRVWIINDGQGRYSITPDSKRKISAEITKALNSGE